jgi:predicted dienelactone hydrolase
MDALDMGRLDTGRPAKLVIWYPQGACAETRTRFCLSNTAVTSKVVVLSHGSMGSAREYAWLGEALATSGFIVVGINHFGESRAYGEGTQNARSTALIWQRAQDISAQLTRLKSARLFQRPVDWNNVVAIGHSAGGQTAASLAGARFDLRQLAPYCASAVAKDDLSCNYARASANAPSQFAAFFNASYQDTRVKKIVLLDPALGSALRQDSLPGIALPSLVVGVAHGDFLPWENHGRRYGVGIPNAQTILLGGQEGHFVFLTPCQHSAQVMGVSLCKDRPGVDRAAVQRDLAHRIVDFVRLNNEPALVARHAGAPSGISAQYAGPDISILEILLYTPIWVFALLAGLCVLGLMQARTRRVAVWLALLLPVAMLALSLTGVLLNIGVSLPTVSAWALGLGVACLLCLRIMNPGTARYDAESRKLIIAGSWLPLLMILSIFSVRYAIGVVRAMDFEIARDPNVQMAASLLLGAFSGFFVARGLLFWRAHNDAGKAGR